MTRSKRRSRRSGESRPERGLEPGVFLLCAVTVLLPLAIDPAAAVAFALPKAEILSVLAYAITAVAVVGHHARGARTLIHPLHLLVLAHLGAVAASAAFGGFGLEQSLGGAYDRRLGLVATLQLGLIHFGAATSVRSHRSALLIMLAAAAGGLLVFAYEVAQALGRDPVRWGTEGSAFSTLGNSNVLGHYMAVLTAGCIAFAVARFVEGRRGWAVSVPASLCVVWAAGTVLTQGRAALLGLAAGAVFAVVVGFRRTLRTRRGALLGGAFVAAFVVASAVVLTVTPAGGRILSLFGNDPSVTARSSIYGSMLAIFGDHPFIGVGPDNVESVYNSYRRPESIAVTTFANTSAHGWPWRIAAEGGVLGLTSFALLLTGLAVVAARALDRNAPFALVGSTVIVTYLAAGVFTVDHLGTAWMFWLAAGSLVGLSMAPQPATTVRRDARPLALALAAVALWPIVGLVNDIGASRSVHASRAPGLTVAQSLSLATRGVEGDSRWAFHWTNLGQRALLAGDRVVALRAFTEAAERAPYDPLAWRNLGTVQAQSGDPALRAAAGKSGRRALSADPHNPEAAAGAAQVFVLLGDGPAASGAIEIALASRPGQPTYLELAAHAYRLSGRLVEARAAIERALREDETWQRRFIFAEVLIAQRDFQGAREQLQRVLQLDRGNQSATALLASIQGQ